MGIQVPVVCAPMAGGTSAKLAVQTTLGGGFGFVPAGYGGAKHLREELAAVRSMMSSSGHSHAFRLPVGVGYLGWRLDQAGDEAHLMLDASLQNGVRAIWLALGEDLGKWVDYIRQSDAMTGRRTIIFIQVNSLDEALKAVNEWKADVLVAQGNEAGGHGGNYAPSVFALVSSILTALPQGPPVLAAGGLATGAHVAAFLTLGAAGAVLGTRFLLTTESLYTGPQKAALLMAESTSTVRTVAFDRAKNMDGLPHGVDARGIRNKLVEDISDGVEISVVQEKLEESTKHGMPDYMVIMAGTGVGEIQDILDAQDLVKELFLDTVQRFRDMQLCVGEPKAVVVEPEVDAYNSSFL